MTQSCRRPFSGSPDKSQSTRKCRICHRCLVNFRRVRGWASDNSLTVVASMSRSVVWSGDIDLVLGAEALLRAALAGCSPGVHEQRLRSRVAKGDSTSCRERGGVARAEGISGLPGVEAIDHLAGFCQMVAQPAIERTQGNIEAQHPAKHEGRYSQQKLTSDFCHSASGRRGAGGGLSFLPGRRPTSRPASGVLADNGGSRSGLGAGSPFRGCVRC